MGLVGRIGKMLSFKTETVVSVIELAAFSLDPSHTVCGIKLHTRLGRIYFHDPAAGGFINTGRQCK